MVGSQTLFPIEVWEMILGHLPLPDLCRMSLVSTDLNKVVANPAFWSSVVLNSQKQDEDGVMAVFLTRFRRVRSLKLSHCTSAELDSLFDHITTTDKLHLEELDLSYADLREVPAAATGLALSRLRQLHLRYTEMTCVHWTNLFSSIRSSRPRVVVQYLDISNTDMRSVSPEVLTQGLVSVPKINLYRARLTTLQWMNLFTEILDTAPLQYLNLR